MSSEGTFNNLGSSNLGSSSTAQGGIRKLLAEEQMGSHRFEESDSDIWGGEDQLDEQLPVLGQRIARHINALPDRAAGVSFSAAFAHCCFLSAVVDRF